MMYRTFYLMNSKDERLELTNVKVNQFLAEPTGLGFAKTYTSMRLGNSEPTTSEQFNLPQVEGDVVFFQGTNADKYQAYDTLIRFLINQPIRLYYTPPNVFEPYFMEVNPIQVDKEEIDDETGMLTCHTIFKAETFWQTSSTNELTAEPSSANGKSYPLIREISKGYFYGGSSLNDIQLFNDGTLEAPIIIEINGECEDPQINFYQNDVQYGAIKLNGTFDYVKIDSSDDNESLELEYQGADLVNPLSYQDFSVGSPNQIYVTFVKLRTGQSTITVTFGNSFNGEVKFTWRDTYVSV